MAIMTKPKTAAQFIISEADGFRSREQVIVDATGGAMEPGTILEINAGKYVRLASGTPAGALLDAVDAVETTQTVIVRDAEIRGSDLTYASGANDAAKVTTNGQLADLGLVVR